MKKLTKRIAERIRYSRRVRTYADPGPRSVIADRQPNADLAMRAPQNFVNVYRGGPGSM